jgi:hypothetical protein
MTALWGFSSPGFEKEMSGELRGWRPAQGAWVGESVHLLGSVTFDMYAGCLM